jgi:transcriptional regulator with XRE-family HTH domain
MSQQEADAMTESRVSNRAVHHWSQPAFGDRLRQLRIERGLSQGALAGSGMSTGYLSRLERGQRQPTARAVSHLAAQLGLPVSAFDERDETAPSNHRLSRVLATATGSPDADLSELEHDLSEALAADEGSSPELRWQALWLLAEHAARHGDHEVELRYLRDLSAVADTMDVPELRSRARAQLARCHRSLGEVDQALRHGSDALAITRKHDLSAQESVPVLLVLISAEAEHGRLPDAAAHLEELLPLVERVSPTLSAKALWTCATVRGRQGDQAAAEQLLNAALGRFDSRDDLMLWMRLRLAVASLRLQARPPHTEEASARLKEAETALRLIGTEMHRQELITLQAHLAFATGELDDARALCGQLDGQELRLSFRDRHRLDVLRSRLLILDGQVQDGVQQLKVLAQQAQDALNMDLAADTWRLIAETLSESQ